jgi:hypothetical protein
MRNHQLGHVSLDREIHQGRIAGTAYLLDLCDAVDMAEYQVPAKTPVGAHCALEIDPASLAPLSDGRATEGRFDRRDFQPPWPVRHNREACAVDRDALPFHQILVAARNAEAATGRRSRHALDDSNVIHESSEHVKQLRERT